MPTIVRENNSEQVALSNVNNGGLVRDSSLVPLDQ